MITDYQQVVPTEFRCITYLQWLEDAFGVSLKFWLSIEHSPGKIRPVQLFCSGSGELYDLLLDREGIVSAPILTADHGSIYPAVWACLTLMEHTLSALGRARIARPSL